MGDNWDDSDDEWDVGSDNDEDFEKRLGGLNKQEKVEPALVFDDEEDLTLKEQEAQEKASQVKLKTKGKALAAKKKSDQERKEEEELARKAMELEIQMEANMTEEERRLHQKKKVEEADFALTDDLFGGIDNEKKNSVNQASGGIKAGDAIVLETLKDHLRHAVRVAECMKSHGKPHFASAFFKECIMKSKDVLDDDTVTDLIKSLNVIKNEKVAAAKRKVKGQAQKSQKKDKAAMAKAKQLQDELFGDSDKYDKFDEYGEQFEDDFF